MNRPLEILALLIRQKLKTDPRPPTYGYVRKRTPGGGGKEIYVSARISRHVRVSAKDRAYVGELLFEARPQVARGGWGPWLRENFEMTYRDANKYINSRPKPPVDWEKLKERQAVQRREYELDGQLAVQIIDAGFRTMSKKLHPDIGGTTETMTRLIRVRANLKRGATI